ncbi:MAG: FAD-binding protein [Rhizobiaceae bacterium]
MRESVDLFPKTNGDVLAAVQWSAAEEIPLEIIGQGSKRALGHSMQVAHILDLSGLSGVTLFEPDELVLSAKAGTPLKEIYSLLDQHNQEFQFEPSDLGPLLGGAVGAGTLGGLVNTNISGPRRIKYGSVRDHILGISAVSGRGEVFKSGGRVVKNVTGYDLSKGLTGAYGTLAVLTDITMKVMPKSETEQTLILYGLNDGEAIEAMAMALGSNGEVSGAAHLPAMSASDRASTLLRIEGFSPSVEYRIKNLAKLLKPFGKQECLDQHTSKAQWQAVRDCLPFADEKAPFVWRVSCIPSESYKIVEAIKNEISADAYYDWQGGLIWLQIHGEQSKDKLVRTCIKNNGGGHATLIRADAVTRQSVPVFEPQPAPLHALSQRYRKNFDPKGVLNPGRMGT